jgi:hypothetical protein
MKRNIILILILLPWTCHSDDLEDIKSILKDQEERILEMELIPIATEEVINRTLSTTYPELPALAKKMSEESREANRKLSDVTTASKEANRHLGDMARESIKANLQLKGMGESLTYLVKRDAAKEQKDFEQDLFIKTNTKEISEIKVKRERNSIEWQTRIQDFLMTLVAALCALLFFFGKYLFVKYKQRQSNKEKETSVHEKKIQLEKEENTAL